MTYKSYSRAVSELKAHLVLVTKYRRQVLNEQIRTRLGEVISELSKKWGVEVVEYGAQSDHIHLLFGYYPQLQLSKFVNNLKTVTSRLLNKEYEDHLRNYYWKKSVLWTASYFIASCGGVTIEVLRKYIEDQGDHSS